MKKLFKKIGIILLAIAAFAPIVYGATILPVPQGGTGAGSFIAHSVPYNGSATTGPLSSNGNFTYTSASNLLNVYGLSSSPNIAFSGSGLNDLTATGPYTGSADGVSVYLIAEAGNTELNFNSRSHQGNTGDTVDNGFGVTATIIFDGQQAGMTQVYVTGVTGGSFGPLETITDTTTGDVLGVLGNPPYTSISNDQFAWFEETGGSPSGPVTVASATGSAQVLGSTGLTITLASSGHTAGNSWTITNAYAGEVDTDTFNGNSYQFNDGSSHTFTLTAPTLSGNIALSLPNSVGTNGYVLTSNGSGGTSWTASASLTGYTTNSNTALGLNTAASSLGVDNTWIGYKAGDGIPNGDTNVVMGANAANGAFDIANVFDGNVILGQNTQVGTLSGDSEQNVLVGTGGIIGDGISYAVAVGNQADVEAPSGMAFGAGSNVGGSYDSSIVFGHGVTATKANQVQFGSSAAPIDEFVVGNGDSSTSPAGFTLRAVNVQSGYVDQGGASLTIGAGASTGAGIGGDLLFYVTLPSASSGTLNSPFYAMQVLGSSGDVILGDTQGATTNNNFAISASGGTILANVDGTFGVKDTSGHYWFQTNTSGMKTQIGDVSGTANLTLSVTDDSSKIITQQVDGIFNVQNTDGDRLIYADMPNWVVTIGDKDGDNNGNLATFDDNNSLFSFKVGGTNTFEIAPNFVTLDKGLDIKPNTANDYGSSFSIAGSNLYVFITGSGTGSTSIDVSGMDVGQVVYIVDLDDKAAANNIVLDSGTGNTISVNGSAAQTATMSTDGASWQLVRVTSTQWAVVSQS